MITVKCWDDIINNVIEFNRGITHGLHSIASDRFAQYSHWYYIPALDLFAPSKFIGYKDITHGIYVGDGDGGQTQVVLSRYFDPIIFGSKDYDYYLDKLSQFAQANGKKVSQKTQKGKQGCLYLPKTEFNHQTAMNMDTILMDIEAMECEAIEVMREGNKKQLLVNKYERNPKLRYEAIKYHGTTCMICGFNFEDVYGVQGKGFIEVHHLVPLSEVKGEHEVDPSTDMVVLCANCHRMLHRYKDQPLGVDDLRRSIKKCREH